MVEPQLVSARRAVCLGGGTGVAIVGRGLVDAGWRVTAVVATTDNGRSTGLVRRWFEMPAPGDLRSVLAAFASDAELRELFDYRFELPAVPQLRGVAFGNLLLGVLTTITGSLESAVAIAARLAGTPIGVAPVTTVCADLCAELDDGSIVRGEVEVRRPGKPPVRRVFLDPPAAATDAAVRAIEDAELVTLGPGSLFTSVLACLAVNGIVEALRTTRARRVYVANTTTQPGQSDQLSLAAQIDRVLTVTGGALDLVLVNAGQPEPALVARHAAAGRRLLALSEPEREQLEARGLRVVLADVVEQEAPARDLWQKDDALRHDATKLGRTLTTLLAELDR
jgi:uncharacterized cofD-like protein